MSSVEESKKILHESLSQSFVEDYKVYRKIIDDINKDFKSLNIDYEWSYDEFCVDFLNESMKKLNEINIFEKTNNTTLFYKKFWEFNLLVLRDVLINKFDDLGYNYKNYQNLIENKQNFKFLN